MDNTTDAARKKKSASPRFPGLSLEAAIQRSKELWDKEGKHAVPFAVLGTRWGYTPKSSSLRMVIAALGYFGLLDQAGGSGSGEFQLSERAMVILVGLPEERQAAIRKAALEPKIYRQIWDRFGGDLPSDENLTSRLIIEWDFNRDSVAGFLKDFRDTLKLAGLDKGAGGGGEQEQLADSKESVALSEEKRETLPEQAPTLPQLSRTGGVSQGATHQIQRPMNADGMLPIPLEIGDAYIPRGMSEDDFSLLLDSLNLWKRRIVRSEWPKSAVWRNVDHDQPVIITGPMGEKDGVRYFRSSSGTGIPESELEFQ